MSVTKSKLRTGQPGMVDFNFFNILGVRLENPTDEDVSDFKNQIGIEPGNFDFAPDIIIRFTPKLETPGFKFLGLNSAGFTEDKFYLLSSAKSHKKIEVPFEKIGEKITLTCEHGIGSIPLLNHIINFTFLGKNYLPLHSSALYFNGKGLLVMGWTKGGKTETLMSFANHGAEYVGDEWVILSPGGDLMYGLPVPICVWEWQFPQVHRILPKLSAKKRMIFGGVHFFEFIYKILCRSGLRNNSLTKIFEEALPVFKRQLNIRVLPEKIFKDKIRREGTPVDFILFAMSHDNQSITVSEYDGISIAERMINSNECEQMAFFEFYNVFKFAFPQRINSFLENTKQHQFKLLTGVLNGKKAFKVIHPYPVNFEQLYHKINEKIFQNEYSELKATGNNLTNLHERISG